MAPEAHDTQGTLAQCADPSVAAVKHATSYERPATSAGLGVHMSGACADA